MESKKEVFDFQYHLLRLFVAVVMLGITIFALFDSTSGIYIGQLFK